MPCFSLCLYHVGNPVSFFFICALLCICFFFALNPNKPPNTHTHTCMHTYTHTCTHNYRKRNVRRKGRNLCARYYRIKLYTHTYIHIYIHTQLQETKRKAQMEESLGTLFADEALPRLLVLHASTQLNLFHYVCMHVCVHVCVCM